MQVVQDGLDLGSEVAASWRRLTDNPMANPDWLIPWWDSYGKVSDSLQLVLFFNVQQLVAVAPLYLENGCDFKLLGSGKVCSDHSELLIGDPSWVDQVEPMLFQWLNSDDSPAWRSMHLEAIDDTSQTLKITQRWSEQFSVLDQDGEPTSTIDLPEDWEQYLKSLSKNHRKRVRRWTRNHFESQQVEQRTTCDGWDLAEAFECLIRLHNLRRSVLPEN